MYEQDIIFGPFSFKQFITLVVGFGLSYLLYKQVPQYDSLKVYIYITIGFLVAFSLYTAFSIFKNKKIPLEKVEEYFKRKKLKMSSEQYSKMIKHKMAVIKAHEAMRKEKGLPVDDSFTFIFEVLGNLLSDVDLPGIDI